MIDIIVVFGSGEECSVRIEIPQNIYHPDRMTDEEREYINRWIDEHMKNVKEWSE